VDEETSVGVPQIVPLLDSKVRPVGNDGEIDQELTAPPLAVGVTEVIATPFVSVNEPGLYTIEDGAASLTRMVTVAVALPPLLFAVTV